MADQDQTLEQLGYVEGFTGSGSMAMGDLDDMGSRGGPRFFGKYRGTVMNNIDPMGQGRLLVQVPGVLGIFISSWAMPCVPVGGIQMGVFVIPPLYSGVWVEFENGNPELPIWVGSFWGSRAEAPALSNVATPGMPAMMLQSALGNGIIVSDSPVGPLASGVLIRGPVPTTIMLDPTGVTIAAPTIKLTGNVMIQGSLNVAGPVNLNNALTVT